ncbi:MAG: PhnD/SsuA/transferrin family substrate-binding protein [Acidobacteria bacterium]|nr:PhnD/SsuA/transferrin family substrate-binding protein [Acidobacteriota bacterium]
MIMAKSMAPPHTDTLAACTSRRQALSLLLGAWPFLSVARAARAVGAPMRLAISETLVANVNLNDARAAMLIWMQRISEDIHFPIEHNPDVFEPSERVLQKIRNGKVDTVALNIFEYRAVASFLDSNEIIASEDTARSQYVLLAKRDAGIEKLSDLRGGRLIVLDSPQTCLASAWLSTLLFDDHLDQAEQFFGALTAEPKPARVLLPVFFGQAEACLTTLGTFNTMGELNPQVSRQLVALATSPVLVVTFHVFVKGFQGPFREGIKKAISGVRDSTTGRQLMTLFQFDQLIVRDADCLKSALSILERSEHANGKPGAVVGKR